MPDQLTISGSTRQQELYDYSIEILKNAEPPEGYYLCTSFGKDSIVAQKLCDEAEVKYEAHNSVTGVDPPELTYFGRKHYPDVKRRKPKMTMWKAIEKNGILPMRQAKFCCAVLKEDGGRGRTCVMGLRAAESNRRKKGWAPVASGGLTKKERDAGKGLRLFEPDDVSCEIKRYFEGCPAGGRGMVVVSPMYSWPDEDLWDFIRDRKMPYCSLYDEGFVRLGCIGCPCAKERERREEFNRWPGFRKLWIRAIQGLMDRGRYLNKGSNAEAVLDWWLSDKVQAKPMEGQLSLDSM